MKINEVLVLLKQLENSKFNLYKNLFLSLFFSLVCIYLLIHNNPFGLSKNILHDILLGIVCGFLLYFLMIACSKFIFFIFPKLRRLKFTSILRNQKQNGILQLWLVVSYATLEEVVFRSILVSYLINEANIVFAIVVSSAIYAFLHFSPKKFFQLFVMGIYLSVLMLYTEGILASIIAHVLNNLFVFRFLIRKNERK